VTASLAAAVCGENPYESRVSALKKKVGVEKPFTGNAATEHGTRLEPIAIALYEERMKKQVIEFGLLQSINENEHFLAGSPDGITSDGILIEVKCPLRRKPTGVVPAYYMHQLQFLMHILNLPKCHFVEYVPEGTWTEEVFLVTETLRDETFIANMLPKLRAFYEDVCYFQEKGRFPQYVIDEEEQKCTRTKKAKVIVKAHCLIKNEEIREQPKIATNFIPDEFLDVVCREIDERAAHAEEEDHEEVFASTCLIKN
jgi:putative phage-type endonuclease